ncbi:MAG TPA: hypothetical protein VFX58_08320 [Chitinophagaceae bacterium]|nr:hypothetical protein [Chitinophagaceae bacterium]
MYGKNTSAYSKKELSKQLFFEPAQTVVKGLAILDAEILVDRILTNFSIPPIPNYQYLVK